MIYTIVLTKEARQDEDDAYNYYEDIRFGLGAEFLEALENRYAAIQNDPQLSGFIDSEKTVRGAVVGRFPYVVIF